MKGRVHLGTLDLVGDRQADLSVHGGPDKAVYVYPAEHYPSWHSELSPMELGWGQFGENSTTSDLFENTVHIGDRFRVGSAMVVVTQPRLPCFKLGVRFGRADVPKLSLASRRIGFYLRAAEEGQVGAADEFEFVARDPNLVTVADITESYVLRKQTRTSSTNSFTGKNCGRALFKATSTRKCIHSFRSGL